MATRTISQGKINSAQWEQLRRSVELAARCFHHERKAEYAIFKLIRQQFDCRASELPAAHFDAAMGAVARAAAKAGQFVDLRYAFEVEALKRIFGPAGLEGMPDEVDAVLDALGESLETHRPVISSGNVLQFPSLKMHHLAHRELAPTT